MQFSLLALLTIVATIVSAAPAPAATTKTAAKKNTCNVQKCVADLAPTVAACASAAAQEGADPVSDATCVTAAVGTVSKLPAPCNGCAAKLGITDKLQSAKNAIEGLF